MPQWELVLQQVLPPPARQGRGGRGGRGRGEAGVKCRKRLRRPANVRGAVAPMYLRAALSLLVNIEYPAPPPTLAWWAARALGTQQRLLLGKSASLHSALFQQWDLASEHMKLSLAAAADAYLQVLNSKP